MVLFFICCPHFHHTKGQLPIFLIHKFFSLSPCPPSSAPPNLIHIWGVGGHDVVYAYCGVPNGRPARHGWLEPRTVPNRARRRLAPTTATARQPSPALCSHRRPPSSKSSSAGRHLAHPLPQAAVEHLLFAPCGRRRATPLQAALPPLGLAHASTSRHRPPSPRVSCPPTNRTRGQGWQRVWGRGEP
jgi:hypothetical protein